MLLNYILVNLHCSV